MGEVEAAIKGGNDSEGGESGRENEGRYEIVEEALVREGRMDGGGRERGGGASAEDDAIFGGLWQSGKQSAEGECL